jgi:hypothetical protein
MGAILYQVDSRNYQSTIAIVDKYGELVAHQDFAHILPPRKQRPRNDGG